MSIQLFQPKFRVDEILAQMRECLEKGWTGLGYKTVEFERAWALYTGLPHAHFLSSATAGLHLAIHILKQEFQWQDGDEIISTPITFVSTNHAIKYENLVPRFADIDESLNLNPSDVLRKISARTKAIVFVGMGGNARNLSAICEIARQHRLQLIVDAAHMAGTRVNGQHVGFEADVTVFSYQAVKNLPTADAGMICFKQAEFDRKARILSWLGIDKDTYARTDAQGTYKWCYEVDDLGFKYHGNSIMAAMALVGLKYLDTDNRYRRQVADWYKLRLGTDPRVKIVDHQDCESSRHLFTILVSEREELLQKLNAAGIFPGVHYRNNAEYKIYSDQFDLCPEAARISKMIVSLPLHLNLDENDVDLICNLIRAS